MCRKYLQRCQKIFEGYSLISDGAEASGLIVLLAVDVRAVAELLVAPQHGPPPLLVLEQYSTLHYSTVHYITVQYSTVQYSTVQYLEVPVEAGEGSVLLALVLQEQGTLLHTELLQVPGNTSH